MNNLSATAVLRERMSASINCKPPSVLLCHILGADRQSSLNRNPTLSYTQRLEQRIKELEDQVAHYQKSPPSTHPSSSHSSPPSFGSHDAHASGIRHSSDDSGVVRRFRGLKMDDHGNTTYHGATSFFHLPSDRMAGSNSFLPLTDNNVQRRERLVHNAYQQRVLENMSEIPVSSSEPPRIRL